MENRGGGLPEQHVLERMKMFITMEKEFLDLIHQEDIPKDGRWAALARTKIEEGTMAINRALAMANPGRS